MIQRSAWALRVAKSGFEPLGRFSSRPKRLSDRTQRMFQRTDLMSNVGLADTRARLVSQRVCQISPKTFGK